MLSGTLTVANNVLGGLSSADIGGNGSNMVTLTGTVAQINATLAASNGLTYLEQGDHTSDTLTVATQDQGTAPLLTATNTVAINVTETNDASNIVPTTPVSATEGVGTAISGIAINDPDASGNVTTTLSVLNGTLTVASNVVGGLSGAGIGGNGSGSVTLTGTVAQINATLAASNGLTYLEQGDHSSDTLTVATQDQGTAFTATNTVAINVAGAGFDASNTVPTTPVSATEGVGMTISGIAISDPDANGDVTTTLSVLNGTLTVASNVVGGLSSAGIGGNGSGSVTLTGTVAQINATLAASNGLTYLEQGDHSSDTLTVATQDQGTAFTATNTVAINVTEINDATNTVPTAPVNATEGVGTAISGIAISDPDANGNVTTTLSVLNGTLTVANNVAGGLSSADIGGNGSSSVTLTGTVAQINATLAASNGLTYLEQGGHTSDTLTVATQDQGTAFTATNTVAIKVTAVAINSAPVTGPTTISLLENASYTFKSSDFPYADPNNTPATALKAVIFATLPGAGTITDNGVPIPAGQAVAAGDIAQGKLVYTPAANGFGARYATFTFAVQNSGGTANGGVDTSSAATATINVAQVINKYNSSGHLISTEAIYADGSYDIHYYTAGTLNGIAYASVDRAYTTANVQTVATYYDGSGNVVATQTFTANGGFTITVGGTLSEQKTVHADGSYDARYYGAGTLNGVAYASVDRADTAANVQTVATYYDGSGNVVATQTFTANGGFTITVGGTLSEQKTVHADGSYDARYYGAGTLNGVAYASVDRADTAANVQTVATYYDGSGNVVATQTFTANGGFTITVGGALFEQKTVNADGSYDARYYGAGTLNGVAYASVDRADTAANVQTVATYYDGSGNVVAMKTFTEQRRLYDHGGRNAVRAEDGQRRRQLRRSLLWCRDVERGCLRVGGPRRYGGECADCGDLLRRQRQRRSDADLHQPTAALRSRWVGRCPSRRRSTPTAVTTLAIMVPGR